MNWSKIEKYSEIIFKLNFPPWSFSERRFFKLLVTEAILYYVHSSALTIILNIGFVNAYLTGKMRKTEWGKTKDFAVNKFVKLLGFYQYSTFEEKTILL